MTKSEKGYYKKFAEKHTSSENSYIILFDAIDELKEFDEEKLKEKLKNKSLARQLPVYKNYLYQHILKSLYLYSSGKNISSQIRELINNINILNKRGLYNQSRKLIKKAKELVYANEMDLFTLEILHLERAIDMITTASQNRYDSTISNYNDEIQILDKIRNVSHYLKLSNLALSMVEKLGMLRNKKNEEDFEELLKDPYLISEDNATYHLSKILYNHVYANYYLAKSDIKNTYKYISRELFLIESRPEKIKINPKDYILMLQNVMYLANELSLNNDVYTAINKLRALKKDFGKKLSRPLEQIIFTRTANMELAMMLRNRNFDEAEALIGETERSLDKFKDEIDDAERLTIVYKIAYIYYIIGSYDSALKRTTAIINDQNNQARADVLSFTYILNLVIHLELGNIELLEYTIRTTYNFLKKRNKLYKVETLFMNLLKKLLDYASYNDIKDACHEFKYNLSQIISDEFEKAAFVYFDFDSWAESKITKKKFLEVMKERQQK